MSVHIVLVNGNVQSVLSTRELAVRYINATWPNSEQVDDQTWMDGTTQILLQEWEVI
jgi:hypothetical protein